MHPWPSPLCHPLDRVTPTPPHSRPSLSEAEGIRSAARGPDAPAMTRWVLGSGVVASPGQGSGVPPCPHRPLTCPHSSPVSRVVYNGKRNSGPRSPPTSSEIFTPAHEENVRFIYEGARGAPTSPEPLLPSCPSRCGLHRTVPQPRQVG